MVPTTFGVAYTEQFLNQGAALVLIYVDGSVLLSHGGTEMGQGLHTKMIQVCFKHYFQKEPFFSDSHEIVDNHEVSFISFLTLYPIQSLSGTKSIFSWCSQVTRVLHCEQVTSRALDIDPSLIHISETATDKVPNTGATAASSGSDLNGMAIIVSYPQLYIISILVTSSFSHFEYALFPTYSVG